MKRRSTQSLPTDAPTLKSTPQDEASDGEGAAGLVPDSPELDLQDEAEFLASARRRLLRDNPQLLRITRQIAARLVEQG